MLHPAKLETFPVKTVVQEREGDVQHFYTKVRDTIRAQRVVRLASLEELPVVLYGYYPETGKDVAAYELEVTAMNTRQTPQCVVGLTRTVDKPTAFKVVYQDAVVRLLEYAEGTGFLFVVRLWKKTEED